MKKYLLPCSGQFYKANLHCHSTISDGHWTPEEIKKNYMDNGYSVVAYTDHDIFIPHNDLSDESFLALNGYEIAISENKHWVESPKTCHVCFIALDRDRRVQRIYYDTAHLRNNIDAACLDSERDYVDRKNYSTEFISWIMQDGRNDRFFVTYNHPVWSLETKDQYCNYHGMHAMEIVNYGCVVEGYDDRNGETYDQMLRGGERIFCLSTDDNHDKYPIDHPKNDSFGGFTMIKAERLDYTSVTNALLAGDFYASEGPEIHELWYENGKVHIRCSEAHKIVMNTDGRYTKCLTADKKGETLTEADFEIKSRLGKHVRFTVYDYNGKMANTHAYFLDEFYQGENED